MKKYSWCLLVMVFFLFLNLVGYAEEISLEKMSTEELLLLKQRVDNEIHSRSDSAPFEMRQGMYEIGIDINPGGYYVACAGLPGTFQSYIYIYGSKSDFDNSPSKPKHEYGFYMAGYDPERIVFEEGEFIVIDYSPMLFCKTFFNIKDYYNAETPEGTMIPVGIYSVGDEGDIPAGKYTIYGVPYEYGYAVLYSDENRYKSKIKLHEYEFPGDSCGVVLEEGNVLVVEYKVIMQKLQKISFE